MTYLEKIRNECFGFFVFETYNARFFKEFGRPACREAGVQISSFALILFYNIPRC